MTNSKTSHANVNAKRQRKTSFRIAAWTLIFMMTLVAVLALPVSTRGVSAAEPEGDTYIVSVAKGYLALRTGAAYDTANEIGELYTGDTVKVLQYSNDKYWFVYSPKLCKSGYVNKNYLVSSGGSSCGYNPAPAATGRTCRVVGTTNYLALRSAPCYSGCNEIGRLCNGDTVEVKSCSGTYWYVYSPKLCMSGYVNSRYLA